MTTEKNGKIGVATFYLVQGNYGTLLGYKTSIDLNVIHITQNVNTDENISSKYPGIYSGIGKLEDQKIKLHINSNIKPMAQKNRRTPFHLRQKAVEKEINKMFQDDVIEEVKNESTPWVSPIVTPPKKNGDVRICVDMREANKSIERERHNMPTLDEF